MAMATVLNEPTCTMLLLIRPRPHELGQAAKPGVTQVNAGRCQLPWPCAAAKLQGLTSLDAVQPSGIATGVPLLQ